MRTISWNRRSPSSWSKGWSKAGFSGRPRSVGVGNEELLCREQRDDPGAVGCDDDLLLDARGGETVAGRAVGLQREDHALLDLDGVLERVEPADDRPLVQREAESVPELQPEGRHLVLEAEVARRR